MLHRISATDSIALDLPTERALAVLWDIQALELYEPKVDSAWVKPKTEKIGDTNESMLRPRAKT